MDLPPMKIAGAVVPDEAVDLARRDAQAQIVDGLFLAVGLGQMLNVKHGDPSCGRCIARFRLIIRRGKNVRKKKPHVLRYM